MGFGPWAERQGCLEEFELGLGEQSGRRVQEADLPNNHALG